MSVNRFKFLQQMIRFDDTSDPNRLDRKRADKQFCVRELFEELVLKCKQNYIHSLYVTVDKMLKFQGMLQFSHFYATKTSDARPYYTSNMVMFVGNSSQDPIVSVMLCQPLYSKLLVTQKTVTETLVVTSFSYLYSQHIVSYIRKIKWQEPCEKTKERSLLCL